MPARRGHFQRAFGGLLPFDLGIILPVGRCFEHINHWLAQRLQRFRASKKGRTAPKPFGRKYLESAHNCSFRAVARRNYQTCGPLFARQQGQRQHPAHRAQRPVERKLPRQIHSL